MENIKVRRKRTPGEKEDTDETIIKEMIEEYTTVPPSPHVLKKKRKNKRSL